MACPNTISKGTDKWILHNSDSVVLQLMLKYVDGITLICMKNVCELVDDSENLFVFTILLFWNKKYLWEHEPTPKQPSFSRTQGNGQSKAPRLCGYQPTALENSKQQPQDGLCGTDPRLKALSQNSTADKGWPPTKIWDIFELFVGSKSISRFFTLEVQSQTSIIEWEKSLSSHNSDSALAVWRAQR